MKIFLSWSGRRSREMALALRDWLPLVLHYAEPWMSEVDIPAGNRWLPEVGLELENSTFGIICLTSENLSAPWLLFEAGAITKSFPAGAVCPLLLGVDFSEIPGPLTQFQAKKLQRSGINSLVTAINTRAETQKIPDPRLTELINLAWPRLERDIRAISSPISEAPAPRHMVDVLEDLVSSNRRLEFRLDRIEKLNEGLQRGIGALRVADVQSQGSGAVPASLPIGSELIHDDVRTLAKRVFQRSSLKALAIDVGVSEPKAKRFVDGGQLAPPEAMIWIAWYHNKIREAYAEEE